MPKNTEIIFDCSDNTYEIFGVIAEKQLDMDRRYGLRAYSIVISIKNGQSTVIMKFK